MTASVVSGAVQPAASEGGRRVRRRCLAVAASAAIAVFATLVPPVASAETAAGSVRVRLSDYRVLPTVPGTTRGRVTFVVHNTDRAPHNLVVLRTSIDARSLPVTGEHGRAREVGRQGATPIFHAEQTRRLTLRLRAGRYLLICNVPGHYQRGMVAVFRVR
jgi:hypothetical protein